MVRPDHAQSVTAALARAGPTLGAPLDGAEQMAKEGEADSESMLDIYK